MYHNNLYLPNSMLSLNVLDHQHETATFSVLSPCVGCRRHRLTLLRNLSWGD